jgi:hypothetical protein
MAKAAQEFRHLVSPRVDVGNDRPIAFLATSFMEISAALYEQCQGVLDRPIKGCLKEWPNNEKKTETGNRIQLPRGGLWNTAFG